MVQWKAKSLFLLVFFFLLTLTVISAASFSLGPIISTLPFTPNSRGYSIHLENITRKGLPLTVEPYPLSDNTSYLSIWCREEAEINDYVISLKESYHVSIFSMCSDMTIEIWPLHQSIAFYAKSQKPSYSLFMILLRLIFLVAIALAFYIFFSHNKNFSVMRSTLITQISCFLILDPFALLINLFPAISIIHCIISALGWWRASAELFAEYAPLVRPQSSFYKYIASVPSFVLFLTTSFQTMCRITFPTQMLAIGIIAGLLVPALSVAFLIMARKTSGKTALTIHIFSGCLALTVCYFMRMLGNCSDHFREAFFTQVLEVAFIGSYALFQTIFKAGESKDESTRLLPQKVRRYDKIDELLDVLGDIGDDPHFDITEDEKEENSAKNSEEDNNEKK